ncbi:PIG-L family deacetylase [Terriglobus albidus]|uniref:PIG-L family deacetylase n=1 Tax=Terriglobus albidus TaxID=1592106 RepID=A0A5B9ED49_9BACT|nr:PIG-L family deacetylase [Terriglobus albidus]QEE30138.1 PIG-L family deacetylase [Terriglobus albidus]
MGLRMMVVVAHPDDECFAFGGAIALATRHGVEVSCICLTDGQAATNRGVSTDGKDLGRIRREEFAASCEVLGIQHYELLDYHDAQLVHANMHEAGRKLVQRMRSFRPHVVVTFGLDGGLNVHPDHTMVSAITSAAYHWAGRAKRYPELDLEPHLAQRLYHITTNFTLEEREPLMPAPWSCVLDTAEVLPVRIEAFEKHASQLPVLESVRPYLDKFGQQEFYTLISAATPQPAAMTHDMFDGIRE